MHLNMKKGILGSISQVLSDANLEDELSPEKADIKSAHHQLRFPCPILEAY